MQANRSVATKLNPIVLKSLRLERLKYNSISFAEIGSEISKLFKSIELT